MSGILILYYSREGENYVNGSIRSLAKGNTEVVAEFIQQAVGGDLFRVETVDPYPADYMKTTEVAKAELRAKARPRIVDTPDFSDYDTIFVGGPCWWGVLPMAMMTALESGDLAGKRLIPFMTHEGSGLGGTVRQLRTAFPDAEVEQDGLAIHGADATRSQREVERWAQSVR